MYITDKQIVKTRFNRNFESYNQQAVVQQQIASKLVALLLKFGQTRFERLLEIGCGTGFLTQQMVSNYAIHNYFLNDLAESAFEQTQQHLFLNTNTNIRFIAGDAETIALPENLDALISSSTFQWFNNPESFIAKTNYLLNNAGILAFSSFGQQNFGEIKTVMNLGLDYKNLTELKAMLEPFFEILHAEEWLQPITFQDPTAVLKHMKSTGVNGLNNGYFGKEQLAKFTKSYQKQFANADGSVSLTYHPIIIIAKKRNHA